MKRTLSKILPLLVCLTILSVLCSCGPASKEGDNDLPSVSEPLSSETVSETEPGGDTENLRESAQGFLSNVDTVWFEISTISMYGHDVLVRGPFKPAVFDEPRPVIDPTDVMLGYFHSFDISDYPETDEVADSRETCISAGLAVGDDICRILLGLNKDPADPLKTKDTVLTFEFEDSSRFSVSLPDNNPPDDLHEDVNNIMNAISMSKDGQMYMRGDIGGDLTVYDLNGTSYPTSSWGAAFVRCITESLPEFADEVPASECDWTRRAVFDDGSEYDMDITSGIDLDSPGSGELFVRPYINGTPSDTAWRIGDFADDQSRMTCMVHMLTALHEGSEETAAKQTFEISADYSSIGQSFIINQEMMISEDAEFTSVIRPERSNVETDFLYSYTFMVDEIKDTYWVRPAEVYVIEPVTQPEGVSLKEGEVIRLNGADWLRIDEATAQGSLLTVVLSVYDSSVNAVSVNAVPDEAVISVGGEEAMISTKEVSFDQSGVMKSAIYNFIITSGADLANAELTVTTVLQPLEYTAEYTCSGSELIVVQ